MWMDCRAWIMSSLNATECTRFTALGKKFLGVVATGHGARGDLSSWTIQISVWNIPKARNPCETLFLKHIPYQYTNYRVTIFAIITMIIYILCVYIYIFTIDNAMLCRNMRLVLQWYPYTTIRNDLLKYYIFDMDSSDDYVLLYVNCIVDTISYSNSNIVADLSPTSHTSDGKTKNDRTMHRSPWNDLS